MIIIGDYTINPLSIAHYGIQEADSGVCLFYVEMTTGSIVRVYEGSKAECREYKSQVDDVLINAQEIKGDDN